MNFLSNHPTNFLSNHPHKVIILPPLTRWLPTLPPYREVVSDGGAGCFLGHLHLSVGAPVVAVLVRSEEQSEKNNGEWTQKPY